MTRFSNFLVEDVSDEQKLIDDIKKMCKVWLNDVRGVKTLLYRSTKALLPPNDYDIRHSRLDDGRTPRDTPEDIHYELNYEFNEKFGWNVRDGIFASSNYIDIQVYGVPKVFMPIGEYEFVWSPTIKDLYTKYIRTKVIMSEITIKNTYEKPNSYSLKSFYVDDKIYKKTSNIVLFHDEECEHPVIWNTLPFGKTKVYKKNLYTNYISPIEVNVTKMDYDTFKEKYFGDVKTYEEIVDEYQNTDIRKAIKSGNEISFKCDKYLLISRKYENILEDLFK